MRPCSRRNLQLSDNLYRGGLELFLFSWLYNKLTNSHGIYLKFCSCLRVRNNLFCPSSRRAVRKLGEIIYFLSILRHFPYLKLNVWRIICSKQSAKTSFSTISGNWKTTQEDQLRSRNNTINMIHFVSGFLWKREQIANFQLSRLFLYSFQFI